MVHLKLLQIIKKNKELPPKELKELALSIDFDEKTFDDTLEYFKEEPLYFMKLNTSNIGKGRLSAMIAISWCTWLIGLGNLIFLKRHYRRNAIIALALSVITVVGIPLLINISYRVKTVNVPEPLLLFAIFAGPLVALGLAIWMTIDAVKSYGESKMHRLKLAEKFGGFHTSM